MNSSQIDQELKDIKTNHLEIFKQKDEQSLFYFIQMTELMYTELGYEVYDKEKLYDLVCNNFKNNIALVFSNMKDYYLRITNNLVTEFSKIAKISISNKYIKMISEEMNKNVTSKNELILGDYKRFIENKQDDNVEDLEKIQKMNLRVITNTAYLYLKEQEYFVIDKYSKDNVKLINDLFTNIEKKLGKEFEVKDTNINKYNNTKDYLLGFNNTLRVKTINIFDEMNVAITLDNSQTKDKMREFNDLITHIYEINIKFDKVLDDYKKTFNVSSHNRDKFEKIISKEYEAFNTEFKLNITNVFRENIKIYNDILYRSMVLKSKVSEFTAVLSEGKVKDLLLK